ncbi:type V CRISPR-associated protein Cas12b [Desulfatirhabdium butyrativorans]|uniref:type V CRISPR-associated protein Cas12b n=1 Tax=Desulfatirhabdium butyrativorans TaxID=340467 RepID=UPI000480B691|nr:type V CRISPR-associated protein Cas12b [Desulfatirhabdium butyrativorans]
MPLSNNPPVTQRAYTLRLRGADPSDLSWREALWHTHEAVNKGAKVFGDWLLTLRGGLDHTLADTKVKGGKGKPDRDPTPEERKARRILLALSWLSVESKLGAPSSYIVASGDEPAKDRNDNVVSALEEILQSRKVAKSEIDDWKRDCSASLSAAIRDDAVWVNRSKVFDEAVKSVGSSLTREEAWDMLERFFGSRDAYLTPMKDPEDKSSETEQEDKAKDLVQKAGQWLSSRYGTSEGADFCRMSDIYGKIAAWADNASQGGSSTVDDLVSELRQHFDTKESKATNGLDWIIGLSSYTGHTPNPVHELLRQNTSLNKSHLDDLKKKANTRAESCKSKIGSKGQRPYSDAILNDVESVCGFTYRVDKDGQPVSVADYSKYDVDYKWGTARHYIFAVMLDHAARRISLAHKWIKRAEAERHKFEEDAKRIANVPARAREWLDSFCKERSVTSGAVEPYRIRRRAVDGWKEVVAAWSKSDCKSTEDRIAAARALQDDSEIDKFGDIQLFEALAEDDALCVWHKDGEATNEPDFQPLIDYSLAIEAEFKKRQFKVPAYRHPDELLHPVFCDFGKSRWKINYDVHKNVQAPFYRGLCLTLWTGSEIKPVPLCWQSKRLTRDLALGNNHRNDAASAVTRADRLGRAASNVTKSDMVNITGLFEQADWNGRLQAPRQQLEAIAVVRDNPRLSEQERNLRMCGMIEHIRWLVTFSVKLQPQGPWCAYAEQHGLNTNPQYWPHADTNRDRKVHARLILPRLPGLRVLSVDLGHRYAAACAVWEAVNTETVKEACQNVGRDMPKEHDLYLHIKVKKQGIGKQTEVDKTTIYRRIGADTLPDGRPHPAPWARLDRQFLIKLQGEEKDAREASNEEIWALHQMECKLDRTKPLIDRLIASGWGLLKRQMARLDALKELGWIPAPDSSENLSREDGEAKDYRESLAVDDLMFSAVRTLRLALQRHGNRARIAYYLISEVKIRPGGIQEKLDENGRIDLLQDALALWHELFSSPGWRDEAAKQLWDSRIATLAGYKAPEENGDNVSDVAYRKKQQVYREQLRNVAKTLSGDVITCKELSDAWKERWEDEDQRWKKLLRWFKDWVLPSGTQANNATIRNVGGLSLSRLATITEFRRKVQVGFFTRLRPDGTRHEIGEQFGQKTLDALELLREQRVKQLASRIAEAALGIGSEGGKGWDGGKRPRQRINDSRFAPCHAVVIENLANYRPDETRTRLENRRLMTWSASKVHKYLSEACQLNGLYLCTVSAWYTSRQDSRTGAPGIRCQDVSVREFMQSPFWRKQVKQAEAKHDENKGDARERFLCELNKTWKAKTPAEWKKAGFVRIPLRGGEIFVSADSKSPSAKGIHADLNAAANIGLRALTDPDWPGKWWYVPCDPVSFESKMDYVKGCAAVKVGQPLRQPAQTNADGAASKIRKGKKNRTAGTSKEKVYLWRDISAFPLESNEIGEWKETSAYQNDVQYRVIRMLKEHIKSLDNRTGDNVEG